MEFSEIGQETAKPTVIDKIRQWLEEQGFPLEMRAASAFREAGFMARQSCHYLDIETGKGREMDVVATDVDAWGIVSIQFVIECKSANKPWVLLSSTDTFAGGYDRLRAFALLSDGASHVLCERITEFVDILPWLRKEHLMGYSLRQAFGGGSDIAYSAAMSVAKACEYLITTPDDRPVAPFSVVFPVIVVDAPLVQCSLQVDGQLKLELIEQGELLFFARLTRMFGTCIRVITAKHLPHFAREAKQTAELIRAGLKSERDKIKEEWMREIPDTR